MISFMQAQLAQSFRIPGTPTFTVVGSKVLEADDGNTADNDGHFQRQSCLVRKNGVVIRTFKEGKNHAVERYGGVYVSFSDNYGETWTPKGYNLDGTAVTGLPMRAANSGDAYGNARGPSEGTLIDCPNGDMLCVMWDSDYGTGVNSNRGAWYQRSTDEGRSWGTATRVTWGGSVVDNDEVFFTEGYVVIGGIIYTTVRKITDHSPYTEELYLATSSDNGVTWTVISQITFAANSPATSGEAALEHLGDGRFICLMRGSSNSNGYYSYSYNYGSTWSALVDITAAMGIGPTQWLGRVTWRTRGNLMRKMNGERDKLIIIFGFVGTTENVSVPGRTSFISTAIVPDDYNLANLDFQTITLCDIEGDDAGYGDGYYDPVNDEYVFLSYIGQNGLLEASTMQYNMTLSFV
jgi:hypothetical protein